MKISALGIETIRHRRARAAARMAMLGGLCIPLVLAPLPLAAQSSPFMTGATALQTNILAWLTPIAIILVITSVHATSAALAFEQLVLLVKQSPAGRTLARREIRALLHLLVDVVIQCAVVKHRRVIREVWFDPDCKQRARGGVTRA